MEHRGGFGPRREGVFAGRNGPPHAARAGEVIRRAGVVNAAFIGRGDKTFKFLHHVRDVEVHPREVGNRLVREFLHPVPEGCRALELARGIIVEDFLGLLDAGPRLDDGRDFFLLGDEPVEFLDSPRVRFPEVDGGAQEGARGQCVALAAHGVLLRGGWQQFRAEEFRELPVGTPRGGSTGVELFLHGRVNRTVGSPGPGGELGEEAVVRGVFGGLLDDDGDLACSRNLARIPGLPQGFDVAAEGAGDVAGAAGDVLPMLSRFGGHQVENGPDILCGGGDVVQLRLIPARLMDFQLKAQPFPHGVQGDSVHIVLGCQARQGSQGLPGFRRETGDARGRVVRVLGLVPRQPQRGGKRRVQPDECVGVVIRHGINGGVRTGGRGGFGSHPTSLAPAPPPCAGSRRRREPQLLPAHPVAGGGLPGGRGVRGAQRKHDGGQRRELLGRRLPFDHREERLRRATHRLFAWGHDRRVPWPWGQAGGGPGLSLQRLGAGGDLRG